MTVFGLKEQVTYTKYDMRIKCDKNNEATQNGLRKLTMGEVTLSCEEDELVWWRWYLT